MSPYSVAIVGSSNLFREGLQGLLKRSKFSVLLNADSFDDPRLGQPPCQADLLVLVVSGMEEPAALIEQIHAHCIHETSGKMRIVLLSDPLTTEQLRAAAMAGAQAVVSKEITAEVLHRVLELVMLGQQLFPGQRNDPAPPGVPNALIPFVHPVPLPAQGAERASGNGSTRKFVQTILTEGVGLGRALSLSERERQILLCLMDGASNKTIARQLSITEATVKVHIKGLLRKIRVTNRTQAAVWGLNNADVFGLSEVLVTRVEAVPEHPVIC